jgi:hypothetical protein
MRGGNPKKYKEPAVRLALGLMFIDMGRFVRIIFGWVCLLQTAVNGIGDQPERVLRVSAEG